MLLLLSPGDLTSLGAGRATLELRRESENELSGWNSGQRKRSCGGGRGGAWPGEFGGLSLEGEGAECKGEVGPTGSRAGPLVYEDTEAQGDEAACVDGAGNLA